MGVLVEHAYGLYAVVLSVVIVVWVLVRWFLKLPLFHIWLAAPIAGFAAAIASAFIMNPLVEPIADFAMLAAALFTGCCFTLGVQVEATKGASGLFPTVACLAASLAAALLLELLVEDLHLRLALAQLLISIAFLASFLWIPQLYRSGHTKIGVKLLGISALVSAVDQAVPFLSRLTPNVAWLGAVASAGVTCVIILMTGVAFAIFSAGRSLRRRTRASRLRR